MGQKYDKPNAPNRLNDLIDEIADRRPNCNIIVAKITPFSGDWNNEHEVEPYNHQIEHFVVPTQQV